MTRPADWPGWRHATPEQRNEAVRQGLVDGKNLREIAETLRTTKGAVSGWARRHVKEDLERAVKSRFKHQHMMGETIRQRYAAENEAIAGKLREMVERGVGIQPAAKLLGINRKRAQRIAERYGIKLTPEQRREIRRRAASLGGQKNAEHTRKAASAKPKAPPADSAQRLIRNPKLSPAQQAVADAMKNQMWKRMDHRLMALGTPSDDEAARLVADFIARRGVTQCAPPVEMQAPVNYGVGWGTRKGK